MFSRFVCLYEKPIDSTRFCHSIDQVLEEEHSQEIPTILLANLKMILSLMSSAKDKAILQFVLGTIYSSNQLRYAFGYSSLCINKNNETVRDFINKAEIEVEKSKKVSEDEFSELIRKLSENIAKNECELEKKKYRLSVGEIHDREFEINNMKERRQRCVEMESIQRKG